MSKLLIINLKRFGDIYSSAHTINAIRKKNPNTEISLLVYKEFEKAAWNINGVENVFTLDRKKVSSVLKNKIYSNAYALEELRDCVDLIAEHSFTQVFNYSNDHISTNITSYLHKVANLEVFGISIEQDKSITYSNDFALLFNDVLSEMSNSPIHFQDCYPRIIGITNDQENKSVKTSMQHNQSAEKNINFIRSANPNKKIVAIQLKTSIITKDIPYIVLRDLIALLKENTHYFPLLLIAPFEEERLFARRLNKEFGETLVIVEADLNAAASVLSNCDLLVGADTVIKHIGDNLKTKIIEVSLGPAPFLKQGPYSNGNLVLTDIIDKRTFTIKGHQASSFRTRINAENIFSTISYALYGEELNIPKGITLYQASYDEFGMRYKVVAGEVPWAKEIERLVNREWIARKLSDQSLSSVYEELNSMPKRELKMWVAQNKDVISHIMKDLLATLRSLAKIKSGGKSSLMFVNTLDKLLQRCTNAGAVSIPLLVFRARIENIKQSDLVSSTIKFESLLFSLKTDLIQFLDLITQVEAGQPEKKTDPIQATL
jgi:ADP-heptose:LPS heptosyltransferase